MHKLAKADHSGKHVWQSGLTLSNFLIHDCQSALGIKLTSYNVRNFVQQLKSSLLSSNNPGSLGYSKTPIFLVAEDVQSDDKNGCKHKKKGNNHESQDDNLKHETQARGDHVQSSSSCLEVMANDAHKTDVILELGSGTGNLLVNLFRHLLETYLEHIGEETTNSMSNPQVHVRVIGTEKRGDSYQFLLAQLDTWKKAHETELNRGRQDAIALESSVLDWCEFVQDLQDRQLLGAGPEAQSDVHMVDNVDDRTCHNQTSIQPPLRSFIKDPFNNLSLVVGSDLVYNEIGVTILPTLIHHLLNCNPQAVMLYSHTFPRFPEAWADMDEEIRQWQENEFQNIISDWMGEMNKIGLELYELHDPTSSISITTATMKTVTETCDKLCWASGNHSVWKQVVFRDGYCVSDNSFLTRRRSGKFLITLKDEAIL